MYSSSRKRCPKTKWALKLLTAAFLAASPAAKSAVNNAYDALIIEARKGNTQPALSWFALKSALSNNQIADWLQIALWAGQDKQVITVYNRYRHQQLPARGYAAVAVQLSPSLIVTCNNGKTRLHCGKRRSLWSRKIRIINGDKF